jgi:hypothetical protein
MNRIQRLQKTLDDMHDQLQGVEVQKGTYYLLRCELYKRYKTLCDQYQRIAGKPY